MSEYGDIVLQYANVTVEWKIKLFDISEESLCSPEFNLLDDTWYLHMYPNGYRNSIGWLSLYLYCHTGSNEIQVSYIIGVKKLDGSVFKSFTKKATFDWNGYGTDKLILRSELKESKDLVAPDGTLTVFFTLLRGDSRVEEAAPHTSHSEFSLDSHASQSLASDSFEILSRNYKDLFLNGRSRGDLKIMVKDREFQAHKFVLAVRSPVFASMFEHDMAENNSGVVSITDCDPDTFEDFLFYVYSGDLERVSPNNAVSLYRAAEKYDLKHLKKACSKCLASNLMVDSICDVIHLTVLHDDSELLKTATNYFMDNAHSILSTSKWKTFLKEHSSIGNELFIKTLNRYSGKN